MTTNPVSTEEAFRRVVAEIVLSLDGRSTAPAASTT
jgi:hypothetical protein